MSSAIGRLVRRAVYVREGESAALVWSCAYIFFVMSAYYVIRPIRDEMGVAGGVENLAWLFTGTLIGMLLVHPLFTGLVSKLPRSRFVPLMYRFFILNLLVFFLLFRAADAAQSIWVGRIFFVWVSVFNLFVISVFWSFMTDLYRPAQSERLFGVVAVGATLGAILGATITSALVSLVGTTNLLLVSALLLEISARASGVLEKHEGPLAEAGRAEEETADADEGEPGSGATIDGVGAIDALPGEPAGRGAAREEIRGEDAGREDADPQVIGGGVLEGIRHVLRSPYLLGIAGLMMLYTIASTFLYFQQADIISRAFQDDPEGRTRVFAGIDLAVNVLTVATQVFLTGRILRWLGLGLALAFLPALSLVGFGILGLAPVLGVLIIFQVLRRAGNYAIQRPAREALYTVLARVDKYKAKNFNDTFVYRAGDQVGAWSYTLMAWLGVGLSALAFTMIPVSIVWLFLVLWLGRRHYAIRERGRRLAGARVAPEAGAA